MQKYIKMKYKTSKQIFYGIIIGLILAIILQHFIYGKKDKTYNIINQTQVIQQSSDPNCLLEEGKLCDTNQKIIADYHDICEKKKLLTMDGANYIQDLSRCFIDGIYCEKLEGYMCPKRGGSKIYYGDTCKKQNLEKIGYMECE